MQMMGQQVAWRPLTAPGWLGRTALAIIENIYVSQISGITCVMGGLILESPLIAASMVSS